MIEEVNELMEGSELSLYEKVSQYELLKHRYVIQNRLKCSGA
jgi:hypothetical protein